MTNAIPPNRPPDETDDNAAALDGPVYEMLWDCRFCGTTKLLAKTHRFCPSCGSPQDPAWRYFPADDEKVAVKDHVYVGADVVCPACGTLNSGNADFCRRCGAPQNEGAKVKKLGDRTAAQGQSLAREDLTARQDAEAALAVSGKPQTAEKSGGFKLSHLAIIGVIVAVLGGIAFTIFSTQSASVYVNDLRWERSIQVERMTALTGQRSVGCTSMPGDAYNVSRRNEQIDTRQVPDGQECTRRQVDNGDGTFREVQDCRTKYRSEPVYGDVCYYTVNRWTNYRTADASGDRSTVPAWPDSSITRGNCSSLGCEQEGARSERYVLVLRGEGDKQYECPVAFDVWQNTRLESAWSLEVGRVLGDARCDTLKPAG